MNDKRKSKVHKAFIHSDNNWTTCTCPIGEDHRITYKLRPVIAS